MQEQSFQLSQGTYTLKSKTERGFLILALLSVAAHINLMYHLVTLKNYEPTFLFIYALNWIPLAYFLVIIWLEKKPQYWRHLTLNSTGIRYRLRFMAKEDEFEWNEIDVVFFKRNRVIFVLKNEERHKISLKRIQNFNERRQVKAKIKEIVLQRGISIVNQVRDTACM